MVDNIVRKPIGLVLLATAHMVFGGPSPAEFNETLGRSFTFRFRFNDAVINQSSRFGVYMLTIKEKLTGAHKKIAEHLGHKSNLGGVFEIYQNHSVLYHIKNLKQNDSGIYWASLFVDLGLRESNKVQLTVQDGNRSVEVSPLPINETITSGSPAPFSLHVIPVLVAPVVLLAAAIPLLIWCLVKTKEKQQQPQQNSNPTVQEAVAGSSTGPQPSLIYSVLDFAKRPPSALDTKPNDTEYAAVSYLTEKRRM